MTPRTFGNREKTRAKKLLILRGSVVLVLALLAVLPLTHRLFQKLFIHPSAQVLTQGAITDGASTLLETRSTLRAKNAALETTLASQTETLTTISLLQRENDELKAELGYVAKDHPTILAAIVPDQGRFLTDTLMIDSGTTNGIIVGKKVYAGESTLIGYVSEVYADNAFVTLYSATDETTYGILESGNLSVELTGYGNDSFTLDLPVDATTFIGALVTTGGMNTTPIAKVVTIQNGGQSPVQKVLLKSLVNTHALRFVRIEQ
jgi:cell shape-determining protein MreC